MMILLSAYPDKLMIWNPGELPPDWTLEKLLGKHASVPFNPDVANVFFRCGMIEAWGRGIERIMEACQEGGMPEPETRSEPDGLWVVTRTYVPLGRWLVPRVRVLQDSYNIPTGSIVPAVRSVQLPFEPRKTPFADPQSRSYGGECLW